jgi:hypothetical protein
MGMGTTVNPRVPAVIRGVGDKKDFITAVVSGCGRKTCGSTMGTGSSLTVIPRVR